MFPFFSVQELTWFFLVLARFAGLFAAIPVLNSKSIPARIKIATVFVFTLCLFPVIRPSLREVPMDSLSLGIIIIQECLIGITLGLVAQVIFAAVEFCGQLLGVQMGFSAATLIDPNAGQISLIGMLQTLLAFVFFFTFGVHHVFIRAMVESYQSIPVGKWHMSGPLLDFIVRLPTEMTVLAIKLAAPVMISLLLVAVALGIMARAFPQMNVFMISFPLNIGLGLIILGSSAIIFRSTLERTFGALPQQIKVLLRLMA